MGIIRHTLGTAKKSVLGWGSDQHLEIVEPNNINTRTIATFGVLKTAKNAKMKHRSPDIIPNGSIIHVPENTMMLLVDGGKIIAASNEPGYFKVDNTASSSIFYKEQVDVNNMNEDEFDENMKEGQKGIIKTAFEESFERFKYAGNNPRKQIVIYINLQEIKGIKFGTKTPVPYTDRVLMQGTIVPCKLTAFGTYSIRIVDPILFYREMVSKSDKEDFSSLDMTRGQCDSEFIGAFATALASLSMQQVAVTDIAVHQRELAKFMADDLDEDWGERGFEIEKVGVSSINYDEKTDELIQRYGNDSILTNDSRRAARLTEGMSRGLENLGKGDGGGAGVIMGMNGLNMAGNMMNGMGLTNQQAGEASPQPVQQQVAGWKCPSCSTDNANSSKFCGNCGHKKEEPWTCSCGTTNTSKFCGNCGKEKASSWICPECNTENVNKFCGSCGHKKE